jgi:tetratricopeptide (TPR) repeat protein
VLDGLERVQSDAGTGRARGELNDQPLRQLLQSLAAGPGRTRALVTSRYELVDLGRWRGNGFRAERVDDLDPEAARAVLRAWGVRGSDEAVDALAEKVGHHALSVAVMGSYVATLGNGDPAFSERLDLREAGTLDPAANRLARLLAAYAQEMEEAERQVMARLSLFTEGIAITVLADLVSESGVAGALISIDQAGLVRLLTRLVHRGLAYQYRRGDEIIYTAHPFVRDAFGALLDVPGPQIHEAIAERLRAGLETQPSSPRGDPDLLDRYEALIGHLIAAGKVKEAYDMLHSRLGGYRTLNRLGEYGRGFRLVRMFPDLAAAPGANHKLSLRERAVLLAMLALTSAKLGDLPLASDLERANEASLREIGNFNDLCANLLNQSFFAIQRGLLPIAVRTALEAVSIAEEQLLSKRQIKKCLAGAGAAQGLSGAVADARSAYARAIDLEGGLLSSVGGDSHARFMVLTGELESASDQLQHCLSLAEEHGWGRDRASAHVNLGLLRLRDDVRSARNHLTPARDWAARTGDRELMIEVHRLAAGILAATDDVDGALAELADALQEADLHGYGLHSIDLRLDRATLHLGRGYPEGAQRDARDALDRSNDPDCAYAWGDANAAHLLAEALLAQGDQRTAKRYFTDALRVRERIEHPGAALTRRRLEALSAG